MKILVLADAVAWHTERYVLELRKQGHNVCLASIQVSELVDYQLPSTRIGAALSYIIHVKALKKIVDELKPDVVNSHFASAYGVMAARLRKRYGDCGALWALTVWGSDILLSPNKSYLHRRRIQYALDNADIVIADSTYLAEQSRELTKSPVKIILWGVEAKFFADDDTLLRRVKEFPDEENTNPVRLFAPRPHRSLYNNESLLISLAPLLKSGVASLTINSTGDLYERFIALAEKLGVADSIVTYESCSRAEYIALLQRHDIMLSASRSDSSPVSLIEAQACGVFPICAIHPGLSDLLMGESQRQSVYDSNSESAPRDLVNGFVNLSQSAKLSSLKVNRDIAQGIAIYEENIKETVLVFEREVKSREVQTQG